MEIAPGRLSRHIDISCVQAFHAADDIAKLAALARAHDFVSAHVLPGWVPTLRELLAGSTTLVGAPVGFPSGGVTARTKVREAEELLESGVHEMDVVVNIGRLRSGERSYVTDELAAVVDVVDGRVPVRAILEVGHLDEAQIRIGCDCAVNAGVGWVKTATGWTGIPTTVAHVHVIADQLRGRAAIKAAGGIRDLVTVEAMTALGVTRFGMNADVAVRLVSEHGASHG